MSDIVNRLREAHPNSAQRFAGSTILLDAADEIERLRASKDSPNAQMVGLEPIGEIDAGGTLKWFKPPIRKGTVLYAAPGSRLPRDEIECVCKRAVCTYDADFGCGLDRSRERQDV